MNKTKLPLLKHNGVNYLLPFITITACFALWGFANDITNPMVKAFSKIFRMSVTQGALVQLAFYGATSPWRPRRDLHQEVLLQVGHPAGTSALRDGRVPLFPAKMTGNYYPFLVAYFILTCGLSFLETSANPYILTMNLEENATRRLNLAQAFNPIGSLLGMFVAMNFIQRRLNPMSTAERPCSPTSEFEAMKQSDLSILISPTWLSASSCWRCS